MQGVSVQLIYSVFLKKGNASSKVNHIKNTCLILMILLSKYKVTRQLSFDTLFTLTLSWVTEVGSIEGEGYKTYFFQVFGLPGTKYLFFGIIFSHFFS